jgi:sensor histidine kinase YesM
LHNKKSDGTAVQSHGVGLNNIKKRLDNVYGNRCRFGVEETVDSYQVALAIEYSWELKVEGGELKVEV